MEKLAITIPATNQTTYPIFIGKNFLEKISELFSLENYSKIVVLSDENIAPHFLDKALVSLPKETTSCILKPGEKEKNIDSLQQIWKHLLDVGADRKSLMINLGGGVIGDIGGFAASTYMRGIDFINIPTTILAQVDESVGGKTMIDFNNIKNIVGTFHQPSAVFIDVQTLQTLPKRQIVSGFAEIIKHGIIKDKKYFEKVTSKKPTDFSGVEMIDIITGSCKIKTAIVNEDEKEHGVRKLLNFGHTIGHAIEAISLETDGPLLHGEAISIGMIVEAYLSHDKGLLSQQDVETIITVLKNAGLPTVVPDFDIDQMITKMKSDKKNSNGNINFTLLTKIGEGIINQTIEENDIKKALSKI